MRPQILLILPVVLALAACGKVGDDGATGPNIGDPKGGGCTTACGPDVDLKSSYSLVFDSVARSDGQQATLPLPTQRASIGNQARLDFLTSGDKAILTSRWGTPFAFDVVKSANTVTLTGSDGALFYSAGEQNKWTSITIAVATDGTLGSFTAVGQLSIYLGDEGENYSVTGTGSLLADHVAPEIRVSSPPKSVGAKWLPWQAVSVDLAEPLGRTAVQASLPTTLGTTWKPTPSAPISPSDDMVSGFLGYANALEGNTAAVSFGAVTASDPSGNAITPFAGAFAYYDLGTGIAKHDFSAAAAPTIWGPASRITDALCEHGSCMVLPAIGQNDCPDAAGFAGLLSAATTTKAHLRYRVFAADMENDTSAMPYVIEPLRFEAATTTTSAKNTMLSSLVLTRSAEDATLPWTTPWTTVDIDAAGTAEIGWAISRPACDGVGGGPPLPNVNVRVLIDSIWAD